MLLLIDAITGAAQNPFTYEPIQYETDTQTVSQISKYRFIDSGVLKKAMSIHVTWDSLTMFDQTVDCYTNAFLIHDTIFIQGYMQQLLGWGFQATLFNDSCIITSFALSDGNIYKYRTSDKKPVFHVSLASSTQTLRLAGRPKFELGERISGFVRLESEPFYYYIKKLTHKATIKLRAYFKTGPLRPGTQQVY